MQRYAPEIDGGTASVTLSALLGGYRADADAGAVEATFLGPAGRPIAAVALAAPTPAERAQVTQLLARARTDAIPPLTRSIAVTLRATQGDQGRYNDAYFDNVALAAAAPGAPPPPAGRAKPFSGLRVLTARARLDRRRRVPLRIACVARTVGPLQGRRHAGRAAVAEAAGGRSRPAPAGGGAPGAAAAGVPARRGGGWRCASTPRRGTGRAWCGRRWRR